MAVMIPSGMSGFPGGFEPRIRQPRGVLTIDNTPVRASIGLKDPSVVAREQADQGRQAMLAFTGRIAAEGDRMARIENKGDPAVEAGLSAFDFRDNVEIRLTRLDPPIVRYEKQAPAIDWVMTSAGSLTGRIVNQLV
ncbi:conserved hypothetical protein [Heliomicrobium modesticaldum Ice1]|uniref:Uncharacterized protein n=1 Tax=Heliobacterium modesticaldum (strain ATCC 51547 / Ice1) TaxID=498761 RepID=B0TH42_HELMI|nr:DUF6470 family protein [Heliomicrobium modesticaldum]ABZ83367.1 conserved hypothetical protein [Heliomicrobium modesticaldum Ice1]